MFKRKLLVAAIATTPLAIVSTAQAGVIDQYTTASSEYAQVYQNGTAVGVSIEGAGVSQVVTLYVTNYTSGVGSSYWKGTIPNASVVSNGINSISVNVPDTCDSTNVTSATYGADYCYKVNATFNKVDFLWKTNGVTQYTFGNIIEQIIGGVVTYSATSSGNVSTISGTVDVGISSTRAYLGKYTDVSITVSTTN